MNAKCFRRTAFFLASKRLARFWTNRLEAYSP
jgi:hypothetical protein